METVIVRNVDGKQLRACFNVCQHATSEDVSDHKFGNYHFRLVVGGLQLITTDGFRLAMREIEADHNIDESVNPFSFGIKISNVSVSSIPDGELVLTIKKVDKPSSALTSNSLVQVKSQTNPSLEPLVWAIENFWYPNINSLLANYTVSARVCVKTKEFSEAIAAISKSKPVTFKGVDNEHIVKLAVDDNKLVLKNNNLENVLQSSFCEVLTSDGDAIIVYAQRPFLKDILKHLVSAEQVEIYFLRSKNNTCIVLELSKESLRQSIFIIMGYKAAQLVKVSELESGAMIRIPDPSGEPCPCTFKIKRSGDSAYAWLEEGEPPNFLEKYSNENMSLSFSRCYTLPPDMLCFQEKYDERKLREKRMRKK